MAENTRDEIEKLRNEIRSRKEELAALYRAREAEPVKDHEFLGHEGRTLRLSDLFGPHDDLIVVHNMGKSCSYCTMWADGFVGLHDHLRDRAAFVISSPDPPDVQETFRSSRGWPFTMVSTQHSDFTKEMGFLGEDGYYPGVSAFRRSGDGSIFRTGHDWFGPYDDYNPGWNLFSLLKDGAAGWEPQYTYDHP